MAIATGFIREVVESYFWYIQRAVAATRVARVTWIEITYKSGVILQKINCRKVPFIVLIGRITDTTVRKCKLSLLKSLGVRSTFRTSTKIRTPRITVIPITVLSSPVLNIWITLLEDEPCLIPKVCELCTEVG